MLLVRKKNLFVGRKLHMKLGCYSDADILLRKKQFICRRKFELSLSLKKNKMIFFLTLDMWRYGTLLSVIYLVCISPTFDPFI